MLGLLDNKLRVLTIIVLLLASSFWRCSILDNRSTLHITLSSAFFQSQLSKISSHCHFHHIPLRI
jgi:hypothetical protein